MPLSKQGGQRLTLLNDPCRTSRQGRYPPLAYGLLRSMPRGWQRRSRLISYSPVSLHVISFDRGGLGAALAVRTPKNVHDFGNFLALFAFVAAGYGVLDAVADM